MDHYKEALAKARAEYEKAREQGYTWLMGLLEGMFPDLKEGEDERIRRHLIDIVETYWGTTNDPGKAEDLAWLEKRKELPTNEEMLRTLRVEYEKGVADTIAKYERKEQKFTEKQDYSDLTDLERAIHRGFLVVGVENVPVTIIKETAQDCLAWMKPAEWSEEDETCLEYALWCVIKTRHFVAKDACDLEACRCAERWLKSLRPQPHWKPSREQMGMLLAVINDPNNAGAESCHLMLQSLFADLQKLL